MAKRKDPKLILKELKNESANPEFLQSLRKELINYMELNPAIVPAPVLGRRFPAIRIAAVSLAGIFVLVSAGAGTVALSQESLPGDVLYPVKILGEQVQLAVTTDPEQQTLKRLEFAQTRIAEIKTVVQTKGNNSGDLSPALNDFQSQLQQISNQAQTFNNKGQTDKALETSAKLEAVMPVYEHDLEQLQGISQDGNQQKIVNTIRNSEDLQRQNENNINNLSRAERVRAEATGFKTSIEEKINAGENKVKETDKAIKQKSQGPGNSQTLQPAQEKLNEAKNSLDNSKADFQSNKYGEAFDHVQNAIRAASGASALVQVESQNWGNAGSQNASSTARVRGRSDFQNNRSVINATSTTNMTSSPERNFLPDRGGNHENNGRSDADSNRARQNTDSNTSTRD